MILEQFSLEGRVGIVTGGGQGLGRMFALSCADAGASIVVAEVNPETAQRSVEEIVKTGRDALFVQTDVRRRGNVRNMVKITLEKFGRIDFLLNNAGITKWGKAEDVTEKEWREVFDVNVHGLFLCSQEVGKHMIEKKSGSIINIASMSGLIVNRPQAQASYNTSKAAVIHLTKSLAAEWAPHNIRINAIAPGYMKTPMAEPFFQKPEYGGIWMDWTPMKRPGDPKELGPLAVFLASDASSFMTGTTVVIDGGYSLW